MKRSNLDIYSTIVRDDKLNFKKNKKVTISKKEYINLVMDIMTFYNIQFLSDGTTLFGIKVEKDLD